MNAAVSRAIGIARSTIVLGRRDLLDGTATDDLVEVRRRGGGRRPHEVVYPELLPALEALVAPVTRGDPESPLRWSCKSTRELAAELCHQLDIHVGHKMLARLLDAAPSREKWSGPISWLETRRQTRSVSRRYTLRRTRGH